MITPSLGVFEKSGIVTYLHCGVPIFSHSSGDHPVFHDVTSKFVLEGLCSQWEVSEAFDVLVGNVPPQVKKLAGKEKAVFFGKYGRHGQGHKLTGVKLKRRKARDEPECDGQTGRCTGRNYPLCAWDGQAKIKAPAPLSQQRPIS